MVQKLFELMRNVQRKYIVAEIFSDKALCSGNSEQSNILENAPAQLVSVL